MINYNNQANLIDKSTTSLNIKNTENKNNMSQYNSLEKSES